MDKSFAEKVIAFYNTLDFRGSLPGGVQLMNPFRESHYANGIARQFYEQYYADYNKRTLIVGINPGRLGAGTTGIPFTDTVRLNEKCGFAFHGFRTFEPSSAFIYSMIDQYGGATKFYSKYFISAVCPLGFTQTNKSGKPVNYNYYNSRELLNSVYPFIVSTLEQQLTFGINREVCFCLGTGKNNAFLQKANREHHWFQSIVALEHPRFIMQYRAKSKNDYIARYLEAFITGR
jgi:hypothetical protein